MDTYTTTPTPPTVPEPRNTHKVGFKFMLATLLCIAIGAFVLLTKISIIPNYLNIEILNPVVQEEPSMKK